MVEAPVELEYFLGITLLLHDGVGGVHLHDACSVLADNLAHIVILEHDGRAELQ